MAVALRLRRTGLGGVVIAATLMVGALPARASTAPVYAGDFPDPFVLRVGTTYYAYATQTGSISVQRMRSPDTSSWQHLGDALPVLPAWAQRGHTWAPSVLARPGYYVLYYTARHRASGRQCISRGVSWRAEGPFVDLSPGPWICQLERGGSIDPYPFVDADSRPYLLWKSDDNALGRPTSLWAQRLSAHGLSLEGAPRQLLVQDQAWEHPAIEGPAMVSSGASLYLFYGGNRWDTAQAAIGYATCATPLGPCAKVTTTGPWLASKPNAAGPGGPSFFTDAAGDLRLAYHAWHPERVGYHLGGVRSLWIDRLRFVNAQPVLFA
jgi:beta-xylosidase